MKFFKVSALNYINIEELFNNIVKDILNNMDKETIQSRSSSFKLEKFSMGNLGTGNFEDDEYEQNERNRYNYLINKCCL